jgi:TM2 domain.
MSEKSRLVDLLLCFFLGYLGVHKFYEGKTGLGILWLCTAGLAGFGWFIDFIIIAVGSAKDSNGLPITNWQSKNGYH